MNVFKLSPLLQLASKKAKKINKKVRNPKEKRQAKSDSYVSYT